MNCHSRKNSSDWQHLKAAAVQVATLSWKKINDSHLQISHSDRLELHIFKNFHYGAREHKIRKFMCIRFKHTLYMYSKPRFNVGVTVLKIEMWSGTMQNRALFPL
jgi:hypothetical protein